MQYYIGCECYSTGSSIIFRLNKLSKNTAQTFSLTHRKNKKPTKLFITKNVRHVSAQKVKMNHGHSF